MSSGDGRSRGPTVDHGDVQQHGSSDWWSARDPDSSYVYWFNGETGERLWEAPALDAAGQVASLTGAATAAAAGGEDDAAAAGALGGALGGAAKRRRSEDGGDGDGDGDGDESVGKGSAEGSGEGSGVGG